MFADFKTMILCSLHSKQFVKFVISAKIWFMKTSIRPVKYEPRVVKLNPVNRCAVCKPNDLAQKCLKASQVSHVIAGKFKHLEKPPVVASRTAFLPKTQH